MKCPLPLILTLTLCAAASPPVSADVPLYLALYGGANHSDLFEDDGANPDLAFIQSPTIGYTLGGAVGAPLAFLPGVSAELDVSWRVNKSSGTRSLKNTPTALSGEDSTYALLANLRYTQPLTEEVSIYGLIGGGYGSRRISLEPVPSNFYPNGMGADRSSFVWQLGGGVDYALTEEVKVGVGYRYFKAPTIGRIIEWGCESGFFNASGENQAAVVTVTFQQ